MRSELFSQSRNHQRAQRGVPFDRFVLGVLKQIVWKIKSRFSRHITNSHDTLIKSLKQYHNKAISHGRLISK
jgi:hypothetical protein